MSFKRLEPEDFLISTDSLIAGAFNGSKNPSEVAEINAGLSLEYFTAHGGNGLANYFFANGARRTDPNVPPTPANIIYHQFANIIQGDSDDEAQGGKGPLDVGDFGAVIIDRSKFKQAIYPNSFSYNGSAEIDTGSLKFTNAGREYKDSDGGYLYPDIGAYLKSGLTDPGAALACDSEEVITSNYVFVRARNAEFNYSQNPTFINKITGGVRYTNFITAPQTFITTVGLYNDNGDLLAVAKLSRPLKKDFTKEALIRIKLDF